MLTIGIKGSADLLVTERLTAKEVGSGTVAVLATPMMIALMEKTCLLSVRPFLEEGQDTVGTQVHVSHTAATPVGMRVYCDSELIEIDRRRLVFRVTARDDAGVVGEGTHERFVIDTERFQAKALARNQEPTTQK
ncbi:MAG: thioesterase family protein [Bacteroidales bacterium]|nr:thioesterase family protein [Bacteroidales bacterium]